MKDMLLRTGLALALYFMPSNVHNRINECFAPSTQPQGSYQQQISNYFVMRPQDAAVTFKCGNENATLTISECIEGTYAVFKTKYKGNQVEIRDQFTREVPGSSWLPNAKPDWGDKIFSNGKQLSPKKARKQNIDCLMTELYLAAVNSINHSN